MKTTWSLLQRLSNYFLPLLVSLSLSVLPIQVGHASKGGVVQTDNAYTIAMTFNFGNTPELCSGVVLAPKLIATAGHCVINDLGQRGTNYIFSIPKVPIDAAIDPTKPAPKAISFIIPPHMSITPAGDNDDISFIVLDIPIVNSVPINFATETEAKSVLKNSAIYGLGFGTVFETQEPYSIYPRKYPLVLAQTVVDSPTSLALTSETATSCDGDSGGPLIATLPNGKDVVLGILEGAVATITTCGEKRFDGLFYMQGQLIYPYYSLIKPYLGTSTPTPVSTPKPSPTPTKKIIKITCVKGKITKVISGTNPKCPTGYRRK